MSGLAPISDRNAELVELLAVALKSSPVEEVYYRPVSRPRSVVGRWSGGLHDVDLDVRIVSAPIVLTISWARDNLVEGLASTLGAPNSISEDDDDAAEWVRVSELPEWSSFIGRTLVSVVPVWHATEDDCPRSVWSLRFTSDDGKSFVVALGEVDGQGLLAYHPDSLLVLFSEVEARSYRVASSSDSAWGAAIE